MFPAAFRKVKEKTYDTVKAAAVAAVAGEELKSNEDHQHSPKDSPKTNDALHLRKLKVNNDSSLMLTTKPLTIAQSKDSELVRLHMRLCSEVYDFTKENEAIKKKEVKRSLLIGLVEYISYHDTVIEEKLIPEIMQMIEANIFRTLPPKSRMSCENIDEDEPKLEKSWLHLQIVYEFILRLVTSNAVEDKTMKKYINREFISKLLPLFHSEDARERDYLKNILHRIYGKFMVHRSFIRKEMREVFLVVIYEEPKHCGLAELLEIIGSIINGFALPLKEEHKNFLMTILIPLHKTKGIANFHQQLMYCVNQYIAKDGALATPIVNGLLTYWPVASSPKQILFLYELEDILEMSANNYEEVSKFVISVFRRVKECIDSSHFQLTERALSLWQNDCVLNLIHHFRNDILPLVLNSIKHIAEIHWNVTVVSLANDILRLYEELDLLAEFEQRRTRSDEEHKTMRMKRWQELEVELAKVTYG